MARSTLTSRRPPWLSLRSGSKRKATSPAVARRSAICTSSTGRYAVPRRLRQAARALSRSGSATLGSPQTRRPSRSPRATRTSSAAALSTSEGRRTEWSRCTPSSQTGYQMPSATRADVPVAVVDEHHVEVAVGAERAPAVAADGDQGQVPLVVAGGPLGQAREPGVRLGGVAPAEFLAPQPRFRQQAAPPVT